MHRNTKENDEEGEASFRIACISCLDDWIAMLGQNIVGVDYIDPGNITATASTEGTDRLDGDGAPLNAAFRSFDGTNMDADFLIATTPDNGTG